MGTDPRRGCLILSSTTTEGRKSLMTDVEYRIRQHDDEHMGVYEQLQMTQ